jgi:hypothetical protein
MARFRQSPGNRGSQRWIQRAIELAPRELSDAIGCGPVEWRSPLVSDEYAEYRDQAFLDRLGITLQKRSLESFWPVGGPQWDALGVARSGEVVLVEAKAHISEMLSSASGATAVASVDRIRQSLHETASALGAGPGVDWSQRFYQYTNRLAHGYLLQELNGIPTRLIFLYFTGDTDMGGPETAREWRAAIEVLHEALGIRGRVPRYVADAFLDVNRLQPLAAGGASSEIDRQTPTQRES